MVHTPQNATLLNYLGYMLADRNMKLEEALGLVKKAVELEPSNSTYMDSLGWVNIQMVEFDQAEQILVKALTAGVGTDPTVHHHLGDVYQKTGR